MSENILEEKSYFNKKILFLVLLCIGFFGILIRLYFAEFQIPLTGDATNYFVYAADTSLKGKFSEIYFLANSGWSLFLSTLFSLTNLNDSLFLMNIQRVTSIVVSTATIIPLYFLCRKFLNQTFSLVGIAIFVFEPHIITNSILGVTEPIYLFLGVCSLAFFLSNKNKISYSSFVLVGLFTIIRYEGLLLFAILSILFFIKYRNQKKHFLNYPIILMMFVLVLLPIAYSNFELHQRDGFTSELFDYSSASYKTFIEGKPDIGDEIYGDKESSNIQNFISNGIKNSIWFLGLSLIPIFIVSIPIGVLFVIRNKNKIEINFQCLTIFLVSITMFIPAFYAYARDLDDVRFLFMIFPLFIIISLYGVSKQTIKKKNLIMIGIIGLIFLSSLVYLDFKKIDHDYEREVYFITKIIAEKTDVINDNSADIRYRTGTGIIVNWPDLPEAKSESHVKRTLELIPSNNYNSLNDFIKSSKDKGLKYLAVDGRDAQPDFFKDIFYNDKKYEYLTKIYDTEDYDMDYHVKVYKINMDLI